MTCWTSWTWTAWGNDSRRRYPRRARFLTLAASVKPALMLRSGGRRPLASCRLLCGACLGTPPGMQDFTHPFRFSPIIQHSKFCRLHRLERGEGRWTPRGAAAARPAPPPSDPGPCSPNGAAAAMLQACASCALVLSLTLIIAADREKRGLPAVPHSPATLACLLAAAWHVPSTRAASAGPVAFPRNLNSATHPFAVKSCERVSWTHF